MSSRKWLLIISTLCLAGATDTSLSAAEGLEFRVDTEFFQDPEKKPTLESLTIFTADGVIYDFCLTDQRATVFDPRRGVFTLLDEARKAKATVTTQELLDFSLSLETQAAEQKKLPLIAFCAVPKFETTEKEIERNGQKMTELRLTAKPLTYVVEGQRCPHPEAVKAYRQFADWCARLNATNGGLPSAARLAVNQALAEHGLLPLEITRTIPAPRPLGKGKEELRSQHRVNWALCNEDQKKIEHASDMIATFPLVSYNEYCGLKANPPATKQAQR